MTFRNPDDMKLALLAFAEGLDAFHAETCRAFEDFQTMFPDWHLDRVANAVLGDVLTNPAFPFEVKEV